MTARYFDRIKTGVVLGICAKRRSGNPRVSADDCLVAGAVSTRPCARSLRLTPDRAPKIAKSGSMVRTPIPSDTLTDSHHIRRLRAYFHDREQRQSAILYFPPFFTF